MEDKRDSCYSLWPRGCHCKSVANQDTQVAKDNLAQDSKSKDNQAPSGKDNLPVADKAVRDAAGKDTAQSNLGN